MILSSLLVESRINQSWKTSGLDSLDNCLDKQHFLSYPYNVEYNYNSRGFRGPEWPTDLKTAIWCLGDSFTVGLGSPIEHTWPYLLEQKLARPCINVGVDGANNFRITDRIVELLTEIKPEIICVHWSYLHRSKNKIEGIEHDPRFTIRDQYTEFLNLIKTVEEIKRDTKIVQTIIPFSGYFDHTNVETVWNAIKQSNWPRLPKSNFEFYKLSNDVKKSLKQQSATNLKMDSMFQYFERYSLFCEIEKNYTKVNLYEIEQIDVSRDGHHYDKLTADKLSNKIIQLISE